ncbi:hypothetical protein [Campylobacter vicugnae]|uniref:hypothetical protein n=1 Tax=Campylobacter vicugnae TaxID=1660076 RepID=UPI000A33B296|nr:hypothetical protein [Campylobacter sp. RM8835]
MSEVRKYDKIILSDAKSKDEIVAEVLEEINKKEQSDVDGNLYICYVIHAYESGDNAAANYIVVSDNFRTRNGLYNNVIKPFQYTKPEIDALVAQVDNKLPIDPSKKEKEDRAKELEADIISKEQSIVQKEKELVTLKEEKATLENRIEAITRVIQEKQAAGEDVDALEAEKRQYERELTTAQSQINTLESELESLKDEIEVLEQTKGNLEQEVSSIKTPEMATKVYVDEINSNLTQNIDTKDAQNVKLTGDQTINNIKTFSVPPVSATNPTAANQVANKAYVDAIANTKANDNVVVNLTTNQTIAGVKTFSAPPVSATNPTETNQVANKAYVDSVGNTAVKLTGNQTIAGNKTLSGATTFSGAITSTGANTFSGNNTFNTGQVTFNNKAPICSIAPAADTNLVNRAYSKKRGGYVAVTGEAINLNNGINFSLNLTSKVNITVTNAASNIGQTGEIFIANGANISGFSAPFNFRVAQSGFGNNEVFSYTVVSSSLVRIARS